MNEQYYTIWPVQNSKGGFAWVDKNLLENGIKILSELKGTIAPFSMTIKGAKLIKGKIVMFDTLNENTRIWLDYLPNILPVAMFSLKLKEVIVENLTGEERIEWLEINIHYKEETKVYYIPRFTKELDVLDVEKTTYTKGTDWVIVPTLKYSKVRNLSMFYQPRENWKVNFKLFINEKIRKAIKRNKLLGITYENTFVSYD